ncbi:MAG: uncharacterized protein KVP18_001290 [Porospora cf. gigantea A]|uniref:uncharacterized protein n=1 Tax=Porospora cf. gigantea A TaxID=2853593 RepID=UPI003559625C|nr:MAG: hypothetical protein KVP18_001290 [Porospora cf. gigantea A]
MESFDVDPAHFESVEESSGDVVLPNRREDSADRRRRLLSEIRPVWFTPRSEVPVPSYRRGKREDFAGRRAADTDRVATDPAELHKRVPGVLEFYVQSMDKEGERLDIDVERLRSLLDRLPVVKISRTMTHAPLKKPGPRPPPPGSWVKIATNQRPSPVMFKREIPPEVALPPEPQRPSPPPIMSGTIFQYHDMPTSIEPPHYDTRLDYQTLREVDSKVVTGKRLVMPLALDRSTLEPDTSVSVQRDWPPVPKSIPYDGLARKPRSFNEHSTLLTERYIAEFRSFLETGVAAYDPYHESLAEQGLDLLETRLSRRDDSQASPLEELNANEKVFHDSSSSVN